MKKFNYVVKIVLMAVVLLLCVGCDSLKPKVVFWYNGWADLTVTNVTTGETVHKAFNGSITINGETIKYEIRANSGDELEILYSSPEDKVNESFEVEFELFGRKYIAPYARPYKISYIINNDIAKGKYAIKCSAFCESLGFGETQTIDVIVE